MSIEYVNEISKIAPASTKLPENSMIVGYQLPLTKASGSADISLE